MITIDNLQGTQHSIQLQKMVIKLGSSVVVKDKEPDLAALGAIADSVARLHAQGVQVIMVSSGAIGIGKRLFPGFAPKTIPDRQALAAIGQVGLMHTWKDLFNERGLFAAQVLLTRDDMEDRRRYLNARYTLEKLLDLGVVPIINENDTVTIDELRFGDNDMLSALVASKMKADLLLILSVVDGLFAADPGARAKASAGSAGNEGPIPYVASVDDAVLDHAGKSTSGLGTGGMSSKLAAMRWATMAGVHAVIAGGKNPGIIERVLTGQFRGTYFAPQQKRQFKGRDRWIAFGRIAFGRKLVIDAGARDALVIGKKSLLPAGVREVHGTFGRGDLVDIIGPEGQRLAKGLVNYDSREMGLIKGKKTSQIREILGDVEYTEAVHRDNLAMLL